MPKKITVVKEDAGLVAFAPFEFNGRQYEAGAAFQIPHGMSRDMDFDNFRAVEGRKPKNNIGVALIETLPPISKGGDPIVQRHILPLKEG